MIPALVFWNTIKTKKKAEEVYLSHVDLTKVGKGPFKLYRNSLGIYDVINTDKKLLPEYRNKVVHGAGDISHEEAVRRAAFENALWQFNKAYYEDGEKERQRVEALPHGKCKFCGHMVYLDWDNQWTGGDESNWEVCPLLDNNAGHEPDPKTLINYKGR